MDECQKLVCCWLSLWRIQFMSANSCAGLLVILYLPNKHNLQEWRTLHETGTPTVQWPASGTTSTVCVDHYPAHCTHIRGSIGASQEGLFTKAPYNSGGQRWTGGPIHLPLILPAPHTHTNTHGATHTSHQQTIPPTAQTSSFQESSDGEALL